jgi:hypothetical protein
MQVNLDSNLDYGEVIIDTIGSNTTKELSWAIKIKYGWNLAETSLPQIFD